jgi:hypothetical protein
MAAETARKAPGGAAMQYFRILVLGLVFAGTAAAQDQDTQEINRYVLTAAALAKYESAVEKLRPLSSQIADCDDEGDGAGSIGEMVARIDRVPAAKAAIQLAGLTAREYVVFTFATFQTAMAAWALEQPGGKLPPGVSQANVDFYKTHRARIEGIAPLDDGCDGDAEEEPEDG